MCLVEAAGIELKKSGNYLLGRCPFHEDDTASLVVTPAKNLWHCFGGGLGQLPRDSKAIVVAQLEDLTVLELDKSAARVELHRVATADEGVAAIAALRLPAGEGYVWCAGEVAAMARMRDILLGDKAHPKEAMRIAAYWKRGASDFHADLAR